MVRFLALAGEYAEGEEASTVRIHAAAPSSELPVAAGWWLAPVEMTGVEPAAYG